MKFSIIIPACQEQNYIEATLQSLPQEAEIIVVCNGCTDATPAIAKKYARIFNMEERNVSKARNLGAKKSSRDILIFLDADTQFHSKNLLTEIEKILQHAAVGTCKVLPDNPKPRYKLAMTFKNLFLFTRWTSGIIFCSKETFNKTHGFNELLSKKEDRDFVNRCLQYGKFGVTRGYVINSMRRFEKRGLIKHAAFWIKETLKPSKEEYEIIR